VRASVDGGPARLLCARVVIAADGANSRLARQAGLATTPTAELGIAIRGYVSGLAGLEDLLEIHLPLSDVSDSYLLPSYGWVFPTGRDTANVGVGLFTREGGENVHALYDRFLGDLAAVDPRFAAVRPSGPPLGAPLRFDFAPERCARPGLLLVGDAAGLVSPFTGEGISYALESGALAARLTDRGLRIAPSLPALADDYRTLLEHDFAGYFEAGRHSSRRYLLIWRVLESTFQSGKPIFDLCRRLVLLPEGTGEPIEREVLEDMTPLLPRAGLRVRQDLLAVGGLLDAVVRRDWPFLARLSLHDQGAGRTGFRPALFLLLAAHFGDAGRRGLIELGAAVELGYLSMLALSGVEEPADGEEAASNWGNKVAILLSDFLLTKAFAVCAEPAAAVSARLGSQLSAASAARVRETLRAAEAAPVTEDEHLEILGEKVGSLFELPCRLGAEWSGAEEAAVALGRYGRNLGIAYALSEDILALTDPAWHVGSAIASDLDTGVFSLPILRGLARGGALAVELSRYLAERPLNRAALGNLLLDTGILDETRATVEHYAGEALHALAVLSDGSAKIAFERLAGFAVSRRVPTVEGIETFIDQKP
jgi:geranylgeranyl pyrophosphate synthase